MSREASRVHQLTNDELIEVLRKRAADWNVLEAFKFLIQMFEKAHTNKPELKAGLLVAAGLTRLYGQSFSDGDPDHPFQMELTLQGILNGAGPTSKGTSKSHAAQHAPQATAPAPFISANKPSLAVTKKWAPFPNSKSFKAREIIMKMPSDFTMSQLLFISTDLTMSDFNNALHRMKFDKDVISVSHGVFRLAKLPELTA